jgi:hypothetical protein
VYCCFKLACDVTDFEAYLAKFAQKPRFKVFVVFVVGVCGVCGRPLICFGSIISSLDVIEQNWPEKPRFMVFVVFVVDVSGVCGKNK